MFVSLCVSGFLLGHVSRFWLLDLYWFFYLKDLTRDVCWCWYNVLNDFFFSLILPFFCCFWLVHHTVSNE